MTNILAILVGCLLGSLLGGWLTAQKVTEVNDRWQVRFDKAEAAHESHADKLRTFYDAQLTFANLQVTAADHRAANALDLMARQGVDFQNMLRPEPLPRNPSTDEADATWGVTAGDFLEADEVQAI